MNSKQFSTLYSVIFILMVTLLGVMSAMKLPHTDVNLELENVVVGKSARYIENHYDDYFPVKELGVNLWAAVEYILFQQGKYGVVIGKNNWLFTSEEFNVTEEGKQAVDNNIELIKKVNAHFLQRGIKLVVVPVPSKARVYKEMLAAEKPEKLHQDLYQTLLSDLEDNAVLVSDSLSALEKEKINSRLFLKTDTHWTPKGAAIVAESTANYIRGKLNLNLSDKQYITEHNDVVLHKGDLLNYLPLSPWFDSLMPEPDSLEIVKTFSSDEDDDLFSDVIEEVALVGTSYSASLNWNFVGALKQALSTDIISFAEEGSGPFSPMVNFLENDLKNLPDLKLVIWEIPERYRVLKIVCYS